MGGASSTRKITIINDEDSGVIKISESVVKRLRGEIGQAALRKAEASKAATLVSPAAQAKQWPEQSQSSLSKSYLDSYEDITAQAQRHHQERDEEIRQLNDNWRSKLIAAEEQNNIVQNKMAEQFTTTVDELGRMFPQRLFKPVCPDVQAKVQRCYEANQKTSLNCSQQVREFTSCVQEARLQALSQG